jgi:hypothetical protein
MTMAVLFLVRSAHFPRRKVPFIVNFELSPYYNNHVYCFVSAFCHDPIFSIDPFATFFFVTEPYERFLGGR